MKKIRKRYFIFLAVAVVVVILVLVNLKAREKRALAVQTEEVTKRDITMVISASGSVRPKRKVDISASTIGKVTRVAVKEGEIVRKGQFLLQIDPVELETTVARIRAMLEAAKSSEKQAVAQAEQAKNDYERAKTLLEGGHRTTQEVETAKTNYDVAAARLEAVKQEIAQYRANLESAEHSLKEVTIVAPMSGIVTRRNVEEGEIAIMGTLNNLGTVLLTIADLSTIETEIEVDETEVTHMKIGDKAKVTLDAFPDTSFTGEVTEIGNSPIVSGASAAQQGVDFKVVVTIHGAIPNVRPGLSADAEITVAEAKGALTIPIQSLTARRKRDLKGYKAASDTTGAADTAKATDAAKPAPAEADTAKSGAADTEVEGVFVVKDGRAQFHAVKVGISSQKYFEVTSGLDARDKIVSGNFKAIRELKDGQRVKITGKSEPGAKDKEKEK
ncbi:MAG: efflux RND transporter periplasmic adaptor subunit [Candidatus Krumholzibacteria bacterium]|nr:efflux RND transporter periplasmic adaptor subunit [Candidatus Krumholzibacteria bacterium]